MQGVVVEGRGQRLLVSPCTVSVPIPEMEVLGRFFCCSVWREQKAGERKCGTPNGGLRLRVGGQR